MVHGPVVKRVAGVAAQVGGLVREGLCLVFHFSYFALNNTNALIVCCQAQFQYAIEVSIELR